MATPVEVLNMLCPDAEWTMTDDNWDTIIWNNGKAPITKKQFEEGFADYDAWIIQQDVSQASAKSALLDKLGITADEAKLLLS